MSEKIVSSKKITNNIIVQINKILKEAKFETFCFDFSSKNKFCYDLLVKKDNNVFLIKVFPNIDNINEDIIKGIKSLSSVFKSKPILIGIKNRYQKLEDNTVYLREGLPFITFNTLQSILNKEHPFCLSRRGGKIVFVDGKLIKTLREQKNISRNELSKKLEVTKRTVCSYENESIHPSQEVAEKIRDILETNTIFRNINVIDWHLKFDIEKDRNLEGKELNSFEIHLQEIINDIGISSYWYKKKILPFDLFMYSKNWNIGTDDNFYPIFSGVSEKESKISEMNLNHLKILTRMFQKGSLIVVNNNFKIPKWVFDKKIPFVRIKDLEKIDNEEEFIELIQDE